jgi:hypothetical protein
MIDGASTPHPSVGSIIPVSIEGVAVTLYAHGLCGHGLSYETDLERAVVAASQAAWRDARFASERRATLDDTSITVSVLHHGEALGECSRMLVEQKVRRGLDAVTLTQRDRRFTLLPSALVYNNWTRKEFLDVLESAAGGAQPPSLWRTHQVAAWVSDRGRTLPLRFGFPAVEPVPPREQEVAPLIDLLATYIHRAVDANGVPAYHLSPNDRDYVRTGTAGRVMHALYALRIAGEARGRADWKAAASRGIAHCLTYVEHGTINLPGHVGGSLADAVLLGAASACGLGHTPACVTVAERVRALLHSSGWIGAGPKRLDNPQDQEFLPGAAVWAMATFCKSTGAALPPEVVAARRFYGNRFREHPTWGCSWLAQGWAAVHDLTRDCADAEIAFAVSDWVAERQLEKNGAFLEDMSPDEPSFNAGFVAEGVAGAWRAASQRHDHERASRYAECWSKAFGFLRTLTLDETAVFPFRAREKAVGGVRCTVSRAGIRIDQVSHALHALVEGLHSVACP